MWLISKLLLTSKRVWKTLLNQWAIKVLNLNNEACAFEEGETSHFCNCLDYFFNFKIWGQRWHQINLIWFQHILCFLLQHKTFVLNHWNNFFLNTTRIIWLFVFSLVHFMIYGIENIWNWNIFLKCNENDY